jgi:hypothetical protein
MLFFFFLGLKPRISLAFALYLFEVSAKPVLGLPREGDLEEVFPRTEGSYPGKISGVV